MKKRSPAGTWILLVPLVLVATPAAAGVDGLVFGAGFNLGNVHFRVGYAQGSPYGPSYYFEAAAPIAYAGYACSRSCYRSASRFYHHPSCGAVGHHFAAYGYAPVVVIERWGPAGVYRSPGTYGYEPYSCGSSCANHRQWKHFKKRWKVPSGHLRAPGYDRRWIPGPCPGHRPPSARCGTTCSPGPCGSGCIQPRPLYAPPGYGH